MTSMFGHKWTSNYGEEVDSDGTWGKSLYGISEEMIIAAMNKVGKSGVKWPPGSPEFRAICLGEDEEEPEQHHEHISMQRANESYQVSHDMRLRHGTQKERNEKASPFIEAMKSGLKTEITKEDQKRAEKELNEQIKI